MEKPKQEQTAATKKKTEAENSEDAIAKGLEGLPVENSPYVNYGDLEDYKQKAYGTQGHLQPTTGRGAGATDAPTLSGGAVSCETDVPAADVSASGVTNRQEIPK